MNLYEIDNRITEVFEAAIDPDTGEIMDNEAYEELNALQMEFEEKTEGILLWIKNLRAESEALKKEKMAFAARQSAAERRAESLERYISSALNGQRFRTDRVSVTWRKSEVAEYKGEVRDLPLDCIREKEPEINRVALKESLKRGAVIPGARLVVKQNMQIK